MFSRTAVLGASISFLLGFFYASASWAFYGGGTGTQQDPFVISAPEHLIAMSTPYVTADWSMYFRLDANLDMTGKSGFVPIANSTNPFKGVFDGNGHKISGLTIRSTSGVSLYGLFGVVSGAGVVKNLALEGGSVTGDGLAAGGIAAKLLEGGTITGCHTTCDVSCAVTNVNLGAYAGGIAGLCGAATIENCWSSGNISASATGDLTNAYAGGVLASITYPATISDCYATGSVTASASAGETRVGGLVGMIAGSKNKCDVTDCYATGDVSGNGVGYVYAGGLVGDASAVLVMTSHAAGQVSADGNGATVVFPGGLFGRIVGGVTGGCAKCYATGHVYGTTATGEVYAGGFAGQLDVVNGNCRSEGRVDAEALGDLGAVWAGGYAGEIAASGGTGDSYCFGDVNAIATGYLVKIGAGGFVGKIIGSVARCYSSSDTFARGVGDSVTINGGGLVGLCYPSSNQYCRIWDCYSTDSVCVIGKGEGVYSHAGGLVGEMQSSGSITRCYSSGPVGINVEGANSARYAGGLIGIIKDDASMDSCIFNLTENPSLDVVGLAEVRASITYSVGGTSVEMKQRNTYRPGALGISAWDFETVWTIEDGVTYPYFKGRENTIGSDPALKIEKQPEGGWFEEGRPLTLEVIATGGSGTINYQWFKGAEPIYGAVDYQLNFETLAMSNEGWYHCRVSDESKSYLETNPAHIAVYPQNSLPASSSEILILAIAFVCAMGARAVLISR